MYSSVLLHGTTDEDPYNKAEMIAHYDNYNRSVIEYFSDRPNDLLILNVADETAYQRFTDYLGIASTTTSFPWENKARAPE